MDVLILIVLLLLAVLASLVLLHYRAKATPPTLKEQIMACRERALKDQASGE